MPDETQPQRRATDLPDDAPWWAKWLVANVTEAYKWASVWFPALLAAGAETYSAYQQQVNDWVHQNIPAAWLPHIMAGVFIVHIVMRLVKFKPPKSAPPSGS